MIKELLIGDVEQELGGTRRMLECVPDEHVTWRPHDKSMSLGGLATHLTNLLGWQTGILGRPEFDLGTTPQRREALESRQALLAEFDARAGELRESLEGIGEEELAAEWTLRRGEEILFRRPRAIAFRIFGLSHMVHHRGQLAVYLRLLDVAVPGMYGPSADEQGM